MNKVTKSARGIILVVGIATLLASSLVVVGDRLAHGTQLETTPTSAPDAWNQLPDCGCWNDEYGTTYLTDCYFFI